MPINLEEHNHFLRHTISAMIVSINGGNYERAVSLGQEGMIERSPWRSIAEPPEPNTPVLGFNENWIDEDYNPEGVNECFVGDDNHWTVSKWCSTHDTYHTYGTDADFYAQHLIEAPTHWMPQPKKPM